jgi:hypothetical protein
VSELRPYRVDHLMRGGRVWIKRGEFGSHEDALAYAAAVANDEGGEVRVVTQHVIERFGRKR